MILYHDSYLMKRFNHLVVLKRLNYFFASLWQFNAGSVVRRIIELHDRPSRFQLPENRKKYINLPKQTRMSMLPYLWYFQIARNLKIDIYNTNDHTTKNLNVPLQNNYSQRGTLSLNTQDVQVRRLWNKEENENTNETMNKCEFT